MPTIQTITNPSGTFPYVPTTRTLTINGIGYDLSADRSWTISTSGTGTVTSVALSATMPTGLVASISGSPITSNGTLGLTVTMQSGYAIPTTAKQSQWDSAYSFTSTFPSGTALQLLRVNSFGTAYEFFTPTYLVPSDIIATSPLVWNSGTKTISIPKATGTVDGYLAAADFITFGNKQDYINLTTTGNSGSATFVGSTLNIPTYTLAGLGGLGNPFTGVLGQMIYSNAAGAPLNIAPNTTTTKKYLSMTGDGTNGDQPFWDTITGFIGGSGTTGYIPKFTASGTIGNSIMVESSGILNIYGIGQVYTSQAGVGQSTFFISNEDTTAAINHQTRIATQQLGSGLARTLIYAAAYSTNKNRGELSILNENGSNFIANFGTQITGGDNAFSLWSTSNVENIRLNTGGNSFLNGGNVGVGINSPTEKLHISGNLLLSTGADRLVRIGSSSNYYYDLKSVGDDFQIIEGGTTTRLIIKYPNGYIGLGVPSPTERLDVSGNIKLSGYVTGGSWQGNAVYPAYGGTGATSLTGVEIGNGTSSMTAVAGTSMQLLRRNFANDNYEFFTPDYISSPMTSLGDMIYGNAVGIPLRVPANTSTTKKYLSMTGDGTDGAQPIWDTIPAGIGGSGTTSYIPKFSAFNTIANSAIYDNSGNIVINGTTANGKLTVNAATAGTSLYLTDSVNSSFYITHPSTARTSFFNGAATRWLTEYNGDVGFENKVIVGGSTPLAQFHVKGGTLATSGTGLMVAAEITNGRLETYQASTCQAIHTTSDAHTYEISAGSTTDYVSGLVITARSASLLPDRVAIYTRSAQRLQINGAGQLNLNNYTSATSFTGTPVAYLACDSSGNIITSNPSGTAKYYRVAFSAGVQQTWINMPATLDFFDSSSINVTQAELTEFNQVRLVVNKQGTAGATGSKLILRYQDTAGSPFTASSYSDIGTSEVSVTVDVTNTILVSSWINMATLAKDDVWIAVLGIDGDGAADPVFGNIYAEFRYNP